MLPSLPQRRGLRRLPSIGSIVLALAVPAIAAGEPPPVFECGWEYCCNTYPVAITVGRGGNVCVATKWFTHGDVNEYDGECGFVAYLGTFDRTPSGVAVDDSGFVYVASQQCNCVLKLSDPIVVWGDTGSAPGQFDGLHGIAIDNEGCVYAADRRNHRVQKLLRDGTPIASFGDYGTGPGQLAEPYAIAVDRAGHFYVTDCRTSECRSTPPPARLSPSGECRAPSRDSSISHRGSPPMAVAACSWPTSETHVSRSSATPESS